MPRFNKHTRPDNPAGAYPRPGTVQNAGLWQRLRRRRLTPRTLLVYSAGLAVLVLAAPWPATFIAGTVVVCAGLSLRVWTFGHLRKNQALATTGPYAYTRNPAYLGSLLVMIGLFLAAGNPQTIAGRAIWGAGLLGLVLFFTTYLPRKYAREYDQLTRLFPEQVARHAAHVPNFFPRATPWRSGDTRRFSWACVQANHELVWPIVCVIALTFIGLG